ncbi:AAA family ATPase [uncultured Microscilla sp.]|uniref:bifunctional aminoglycoside phosphotransferase/ATP-binding protein n=1 Tax=uncultured Microscilla sp. TaxID=432653 RepID=UPI00261AC716|nr:AAA family ATPase [uncultured Microscilla sp.]
MTETASMLTDEILQFLSTPQVFAERPQKVSVVQTHISIVSLLDEVVYKVKKAVDFGFLNFMKLEDRKYYLEEEVRLNSRLTTDLYLDLVPIYRLDNGALSFTSEQSTDVVVEYALKMKRLPHEFFLDELLKKNTFDWQNINLIANKLARFYQHIPVDAHKSKWGRTEFLREIIDENFEQITPFVNNTIQTIEFRVLRAYQYYFLENNKPWFHQRVAEGKILECHGDLKCDHIHVENQQVNIYDCIEFNERYRCIDVLNDIAFLSMELDFRRKFNLSNYFVNQVTNQLETGEYQDLFDFYKSFRAFVKGKVESFTSTTLEVPAKKRHKCAERARKYFKLALKYALIGSEATLVVVYGGVATGKTTLAQKIAKHMNIQHFNSDLIRKKMAGIPTYERTRSEDLQRVYSTEMTEKVYETLIEEGINCAFQEGTSILDATFRDITKLERLLKKVREAQPLRVVFIEAIAPDEEIKQRLRARENEPNVSDARIEHFEMLRQSRHQIAKMLPNHLTLNTANPLQKTMVNLFVQMFEARLLN